MNHETAIKRIQELVPDLGERYKDSIYIAVREGAGGYDPSQIIAIENFIEQALKEQAEQICAEIIKRADDTPDDKEKSGLVSAYHIVYNIISKYK